MKVSCIPVSFFPEIVDGKITIKEWARIGAELSLDAIDLSIIFLKNHTPVYVRQVRNDIESEGMSITMITTYPDFSHPNPIQREREMKNLKHDIVLASNLGARYLRILAGQAHPETNSPSREPSGLCCSCGITSSSSKQLSPLQRYPAPPG